MNNVEPLKSTVNATLDDVLHFAEQMGERGEYSATNARLYQTALRRLTSVLADDEARDPASLLADIDNFGRRWGVKENAKPETIAAYVRRARALLTDFIAYQADPASFKGRTRKRTTPDSGQKGKSKSRASKQKSLVRSDREPTGGASEREKSAGPSRSFPLGEGREFVYQFDGELSREQVFKLSLHLLAMCPDFTPEDMRRFMS